MVPVAARIPPALSALLLAALACGGAPPVASDPVVREDPAPALFSRDRVWSELEALAALGPRPVGSDAAEAARSLLSERLTAAGVAVETVDTLAESDAGAPVPLTHLVATLPGQSRDRIVLMAPYGSGVHEGYAFAGVNDGASGAALLVELARVLAGRERPYSYELVWLEGEGRLGRGEGAGRERRWLGSEGLAERWAEEGHLDGIRLLVAFNRVCDADLRLARDLGSHRAHREEFWRAARRLGRSASFSPTSRYESVASSHGAFRAQGLRRVLAIEDTVFGGEEAPGLFAGEGDALSHCDPASLETVGVVALEALGTIAARLAKIDRFARTPSVVGEEAVEEAPEDAAGDDAAASSAEPSAPAGPEADETPDAAGGA